MCAFQKRKQFQGTQWSFIAAFVRFEVMLGPPAPTGRLAAHIDQIVIVRNKVLRQSRDDFANLFFLGRIRHQVKVERVSVIMAHALVRAGVAFPPPLAIRCKMPFAIFRPLFIRGDKRARIKAGNARDRFQLHQRPQCTGGFHACVRRFCHGISIRFSAQINRGPETIVIAGNGTIA